MQADLETLPAQLVAHLAGPEAGVGPPLRQNAEVPSRHDVIVTSGDRAVGQLALGVQPGTPPPLVDGEAGDPQLRGGGRQALGGGEFQGSGPLGGGVDPGHLLAAGQLFLLRRGWRLQQGRRRGDRLGP